MLRFLARLALVVVGCAMLTGQCSAHATLVGSDPAEGNVVGTAPETVRLSFNEPVTPLALKLFGPDGQGADITAAARDNELIVQLPAVRGEGTYALSWRVASTDGHPIGGTSTFSIGHASHRAPSPTVTVNTAGLLIWLARIGIYIGWIGGVGGALFLKAIATGQRQVAADRTILALLGVGALSTAFSFGLQGLDELGTNLIGLASVAPWAEGLASPYGKTLCLGAIALIGSTMALRLLPGRLAATVAVSAFLMVAFALTLSGHASTASPSWLTRPALALHGAAATLWGGSLLPLLILTATRHENAGRTAMRLSALLLPTVAVLAMTGLTLAYLQQVTIASLMGTDYGRLLAGKLAIVLCMLAIGALNRLILVPRAAAGADVPFRQLGRVLVVDVCLLLVVIAVVAGWRFTPPPRSIAALEIAQRHRQMLHVQTTKGMAMIQLGERGDLDIRLSGAGGRAMIAQDVRVSLANPVAGIEPLQRQAIRVDDGHWRVDSLALPVGGGWALKLNVLISDFDSLSFEGTLAVP